MPLMRPVTVPSDLELPRTDGWFERSAATADVIILLGLRIITHEILFHVYIRNERLKN